MTASKKIAAVLVTDDPMVEIAIRYLFRTESDFLELHSTLPFKELHREKTWPEAEIVVADVTRRENLEQLTAFRKRVANTLLLCWCGDSVMEIAAEFRDNCDGVVSRLASGSDFMNALREMAKKRAPAAEPSQRQMREVNIHLTYRESQLVALLARGYKNKEIAACLGIGTGTVKVYLSTLFKKTGAKDRLELGLFGLKNVLFGRAEVGIPVPGPMAARRDLSRPMLTSIRLLQPLSSSF